ncbi:hypothetical protein U1Q18_012379 [Sarracenia purpurea var. burkii]
MEKKKEDDNLHAVWFAAGTLVAAACLQRASVASLVEQWRVWVFLALNLLLLAILFTSTCINNDNNNPSASSDDVEASQGERRMVAVGERCGGGSFLRLPNSGDQMVEDGGESGRRGGGIRQNINRQLSGEELNRRVEAFIAMFRRQLVLDAANGSRFRSTTGPNQRFLY